MSDDTDHSSDGIDQADGDNSYLTSKYAFKESWTWPKDVADWMERELASLTMDTPEPIVHICSGSSNLGQLTVDAFHEDADINADALNLPVREGTIGTVITDPPWKWDPATRGRFGDELHRVMEPEGLLLWCAPWMPAFGLFKIQKLVVAAARVGLPKNARLLVRARRRGSVKENENRKLRSLQPNTDRSEDDDE